jgi:hypothetical protein
MAIDNKIFVGGLNTDDEDRIIPNGDYRYALNIRNSKSDSDSQGSIENVNGNEEVSYSLGIGNFKCVGAYDDKLNNKVYYFVWSSNGSHKILEYDAATTTVNLVLESDLLNLSEDNFILEQNITVLDGKMYWTNKKPYKINIERAKTNGYPSPLLEEYILAIVPAPNNSPRVEYGSNIDVKINNVRNKLFQFRYKFVYLDNEESAWSPISKVALPVDEAQYRPFSYYDTTLNNFIKVQCRYSNNENPLVSRIKIAFREGNTGDFYLAKDIKKEDMTSFLVGNNYEFEFYNNEVYTSLDNDGNKGMRLFDRIPLESNTQSLIDGNKLAYGGITEGFDPVDIDIDIEPVSSEVKNVPAPNVSSLVGYQSADGVLFPFTGNGILQFNSNFVSFSGVASSINGLPYFLDVVWGSGGGLNVLTGGYGISNNPYGSQASDWIGIKPLANSNAVQYLTTAQVKSVIIGDPLGEEGIRYTVTVDVNLFNWDKNSYEDKKIKVQYLTQSGDGILDVYNGLKSALISNNYSEEYLTFSFGDFFTVNAPGLASYPVPSGSAAMVFNVRATVPQVKVVAPSGFDPFGVPFAAGGRGVDKLPCIRTSDVKIRAYAAWTTLVEKTLKSGSTHGIGIVYYDNPNRSGLTNVTKEKLFYVPFPTERNIQSGYLTTDTDLDIRIKHLPPDWAKYYQIVYTGNQTIENIPSAAGYKGFIQCKLRNVQSSSIPGALKAKLTELTDFNATTPEATGLGYGFTKGDRIRFLMDSSENFLQQYSDVEIVSFDQSTEEIIFKSPDISISDGYTVELYTPKKDNDNDVYFEIGEVFSIGEDSAGNKYHEGDTPQDPLNPITTPATIFLDDIGDVYLRFRTAPTSRQIEDYHYSDYYDSDSWDKGRPNIVDDNIKRIYRPTTIRYTEAFIPETNINGLSRIDDFSFESYDQKYGDIMLMYSEDKGLNIFQKLKVGQVGVNQSTLYSNDGSTVGTVGSNTRVLSDIRYYTGEFGIGNNPESFAVYGNMKYFVDSKRGAVLRLGGDGITPISEYKMHNYFNDKFIELDTMSDFKAIGVYDTRFDEYILNLSGGDVNETIAYSEGKNRWVTFYSYEPDFMVSNRVGLITFKNGVMFNHNTSGNYNVFYYDDSVSKIRFVSNVEPTKIKIYDYITQDATDVWYMPEATNQFGQKTSLVIDDFQDVEGVFKTALLRDENTPNVQFPLIEGDSMRSHSMDITLENDSIGFTKLFSVGVGVHLSELTNR